MLPVALCNPEDETPESIALSFALVEQENDEEEQEPFKWSTATRIIAADGEKTIWVICNGEHYRVETRGRPATSAEVS